MNTHSILEHLRNVQAGSIRQLRTAIVLCVPLIAAGCTSAPLQEGGTLSSYSSLKPSDGILTKTRQHIDSRALLAARTVKILPTQASIGAARSGLSQPQMRLVGNAIDRAVCRELSNRLEVVSADQPADLTVRTVLTQTV